MAVSRKAMLDYIAAHPGARREDIRLNAAPAAGETTVWRHLRALVAQQELEVSGKGPGTRYRPAGSSIVRQHLKTPYRALVRYQKGFLDAYVPNKSFYLTPRERDHLLALGRLSPAPMPAGTYARRILEKLLIDLSWASSRMEGNTYSILDTERLIRFGEEASGKDRKEAVMILNHKDAIQYVVDNIADISISRRDLCNIHALLASGLLVNPAMAGRLRQLPVEIAHSSYNPLDDKIDIEDEFDVIVDKAAAVTDPFEQSLFVLMHIPYLQAFDDVNKRTARVASNIALLKADLAPMSFVAMNDRDYVDGLLGVYELNNISLLKQAYIAAYGASAENYKTMRAEIETPDKAALVYRDFVKEAVRQCVLEWKTFRPQEIMELAMKAAIPEADRSGVVAYVGAEFKGLHEGNCIRYRLVPADLVGLSRVG